jgi:hypothetical protein
METAVVVHTDQRDRLDIGAIFTEIIDGAAKAIIAKEDFFASF